MQVQPYILSPCIWLQRIDSYYGHRCMCIRLKIPTKVPSSRPPKMLATLANINPSWCIWTHINKQNKLNNLITWTLVQHLPTDSSRLSNESVTCSCLQKLHCKRCINITESTNSCWWQVSIRFLVVCLLIHVRMPTLFGPHFKQK